MVRPLCKPGAHRPFKHRLHLKRWPGQQDRRFAVLFQRQPWRRTRIVFKNHGVFRHFRLLQVVGRRLHALGGKERRDPPRRFLVEAHLFAEISGDRFLCEIIIGRTEATRHHHEVCPRKRLLQFAL